MSEDRLGQEGRDEPEYPNLRLVLRWPHPRGLPLWLGHGRYSRNNPKPRWYWTPGVAAGKEWRWEKSPLQMGIMINSRGERRTKALEGTEVEQQTPSKWGWETRGNKLSRPPTLHESPCRVWLWGTILAEEVGLWLI